MAMSLQEQLRAKRAEAERWIRDRDAEVRRAAAQAEAKGRQVYAQTIRTGQQVLARTPAELRDLGVAALQGRLPQAVGVKVAQAVTKPKPASVRVATTRTSAANPAAPGSSVRRQAQAGLSGFVDEASFGLADRALALGDAVGDAARMGNFDVSDVARAYGSNMDVKQAEDDYDAQHYALARNSGRVAGFVGSTLVMGAPAVTRAVVSRLPRSATLLKDIAVGATRGPDARGLTTLAAGGGAVVGAVGQSIADRLAGRRSDPAELVGAAVGGSVGGVATRFLGPTTGGAIGGAATSIASDALHGRAPSLDTALGEGRAGAIMGRAGDFAGRGWIAGQTSKIKGIAGETLSQAKAMARGDKIVGLQKRVAIGGNKHSVADYVATNRRTGQEVIGESKMGPYARLTPNQKIAQKRRPDEYIVDHWRFSDVGAAAGMGMAPIGANVMDERDE